MKNNIRTDNVFNKKKKKQTHQHTHTSARQDTHAPIRIPTTYTREDTTAPTPTSGSKLSFLCCSGFSKNEIGICTVWFLSFFFIF